MIAIGNDHQGCELKQQVIEFLQQKSINYKDFGTDKGQICDYPDIAKMVCSSVTNGECKYAILICKTGIGMAMAANKIKGIRAAVCSDYYSANYTRLHNDANVLCLGQGIIGAELACGIVEIFLNTSYEGGRHDVRIKKISNLEV